MRIYINIYIYIYIKRQRESNQGEKNYIFQKYFRLTSLPNHSIYISLKTVTQSIFYNFYS